jgi:hypothetical protein
MVVNHLGPLFLYCCLPVLDSDNSILPFQGSMAVPFMMLTRMVADAIAVLAYVLAADERPVKMAHHRFFRIGFINTKHYLYIMPLKG